MMIIAKIETFPLRIPFKAATWVERSGPMSEQENLKLVQQFYAAFKTGNINGVLSTFAEMQDAEQFEVQGFVAQGDKVVAFGHYRWRVKSTGHSYESDFAHAFTISHGKVSRFQEYVDTQLWAAAYRTAKSPSASKINQ